MEQSKLTQEIEITLKRMSGDYAAKLSDEAHELLEFHLTQLLEAKREYLAKQLDSQSAWQLGPTGHTVKKCSCYHGFKINPRTLDLFLKEALNDWQSK